MSENTTNQAMPFDTRGRKPWLYLASDTSLIHFLVSNTEGLTWYAGLVTDPPQVEQYESTDGEPLWWRDGEIGGDMTTDPTKAFDPEDLSETPIPVMAYVYDIKQAAAVTFEEITRGWGTALMPKFELGGGDPAGNKKARIYKDDTAFRIEYDRAPEGASQYYVHAQSHKLYVHIYNYALNKRTNV